MACNKRQGSKKCRLPLTRFCDKLPLRRSPLYTDMASRCAKTHLLPNSGWPWAKRFCPFPISLPHPTEERNVMAHTATKTQVVPQPQLGGTQPRDGFVAGGLYAADYTRACHQCG